MPGGRGCRERQSERFRERKNDETMARIRAETFQRLFSIDVPYEGKTESEVIELGTLLANQSLLGAKYAVEVVACDFYQSDPVLAECCVDEQLFDVDCSTELEDLEVVYHQVRQDEESVLVEQCLEPTVNEYGIPCDDVLHSECTQTECVTQEVITCGEHEGNENHSFHSSHPIVQSGVASYRRCDRNCVCETYSKRDHYQRVNRTRTNFMRYRKRKFCACVSDCPYAVDLESDYRRTLSKVLGYKQDNPLSPGVSMGILIYKNLPLEIQYSIDEHLGCREKFLLQLMDGRLRKGCNEKQLYTSPFPFTLPRRSSTVCGKTIKRCVCESVAYKYGIPDNFGAALGKVGRTRYCRSPPPCIRLQRGPVTTRNRVTDP